jgi:hypothetical protein
VFVYGENTTKWTKKAQKGHCFQGLGWIKVRCGYFSCLSFVLAQGKGFRFMLGYMETVLQRVVFARQRRNCLHDFEATVRSVKLGMMVIAKTTSGKGNTSLLRGPSGRLNIVATGFKQ